MVTTTTPGAGSPAGTFATKKATIFFDKNLVFNAKAFKECKPSNKSAPVGSDVKAKCAERQDRRRQGRRPGHGRRTGGPDRHRLQRRGQGQRPTAGSTCTSRAPSPLKVDSVIAATLKKASGDYGVKLVVPIPPNLVQPLTGVTATLLNFSTSVGGTSKGVPYVG